MAYGEKFIYDEEQATFYLEHGAKLKRVDKHYHTGNTFWVFDFDSTGRAWHDWKAYTQEEWKQGKFKKNK